METEKTIALRSGGQMTLKATFDPFELSAEDRAFVFGLVDALGRYEKNEPPVERAMLAEKLDTGVAGPRPSPQPLHNTLPNSDRHYGG
jgi:hypothetical protein